MTRAKAAKSYPAIYLEYAETLSKNPRLRIKVPFETEKQAMEFRLDFNSFKGAALKEKLDEMFPEIAAFYVTVEGNVATVQHKDHTEIAERLKTALEQATKEGG